MSVITRNEFGAIAVNKSVIEHMIVEDMLSMSDCLVLSNKKGKPIKDKPTPIIDPDYFDAVEVSDKRGIFKVKIYIVVRFGHDISGIAERVFDAVEHDFELLRLEKPETISVKVRGIMDLIEDELVKRSIDLVRNNG